MNSPRNAVLTLAGAALALLGPAAFACPSSPIAGERDHIAISDTAASAPEHPSAAFARMLAPRTPAAGETAGVEHPDPLTASFQATLWTSPNARPVEPAARLAIDGSRR